MKPATRLLERSEQALGRPLGVEVIELRTAQSKTFYDGKEFHLAQRLRPVHYLEGGYWQDIDLSFDDDLHLDQAPFEVHILPEAIGYRYVSRRAGWMEMELLSINGEEPNPPAPHRQDDRVYWNDIIPGVSMYLEVRPEHPEMFKVYDMAPVTTRWRITQSPDFAGQFNPKTRGKDHADANLEIQTSYEDGIFTETVTGRVSRVVDKRRRKKAWHEDATFPLLMDASITEDIGVTSDDVSSYRGGSVYPTFTNSFQNSANVAVTLERNASSVFYVVQIGGFRFQTLAIPKGSTITRATLTVNVTQVTSGPAISKFYADAIDDAPMWADKTQLARNIQKTVASATFTATVTGIQVITVTSLVAEVVGRPGWQEGNDMRFAGFPQATGYGSDPGGYTLMKIEDFSAAGTDEAQLDVTFTPPNPGGGGSGFGGMYSGPRQRLIARGR